MNTKTEKKMNNQVNIQDLEDLVKLKHKIRSDLMDKGFDPDDAADFVDNAWKDGKRN